MNRYTNIFVVTTISFTSFIYLKIDSISKPQFDSSYIENYIENNYSSNGTSKKIIVKISQCKIEITESFDRDCTVSENVISRSNLINLSELDLKTVSVSELQRANVDILRWKLKREYRNDQRQALNSIAELSKKSKKNITSKKKMLLIDEINTAYQNALKYNITTRIDNTKCINQPELPMSSEPKIFFDFGKGKTAAKIISQYALQQCETKSLQFK